MRRKALYFALAAVILLSCVGALAAGPVRDPETEDGYTVPKDWSEWENDSLWEYVFSLFFDWLSAEDQGAEAPETTPHSGAAMTQLAAGLNLIVDEATGDMTVIRPEQTETAPMGEPDTWTIFLYLCGTDLESDRTSGGRATFDLAEMLAATASADIRFVIETGGARRWYTDALDAGYNERLVIQSGQMTKVEQVPRAGMGDSATLADFLTWGVENYPAKHMGVILWDHGGGSITGSVMIPSPCGSWRLRS